MGSASGVACARGAADPDHTRLPTTATAASTARSSNRHPPRCHPRCFGSTTLSLRVLRRHRPPVRDSVDAPPDPRTVGGCGSTCCDLRSITPPEVPRAAPGTPREPLDSTTTTMNAIRPHFGSTAAGKVVGQRLPGTMRSGACIRSLPRGRRAGPSSKSADDGAGASTTTTLPPVRHPHR